MIKELRGIRGDTCQVLCKERHTFCLGGVFGEGALGPGPYLTAVRGNNDEYLKCH